MARLEWAGNPPMYDRGVNQGVLYLDDEAYAWNGLISVDERDTGEVEIDHYFDGNRIHISQVTGDFEATISAYTYPERFSEYNGYSDRETYKRFGFSYRTERGDGYRLHLVYNALVLDNNRAWVTDSNSPHPSAFAWDIHGSSVPIPGASPSSRLTLESNDYGILEIIEDILYGTSGSEPRLPSPEEIVELYEASALFKVVYNGDGTYTVTGPDNMVRLLDDGMFELNAPSVFLLDEDIFVVQSY